MTNNQPSLADQISAIRFAMGMVGRKPPTMRESEAQWHREALSAAIETLERLSQQEETTQ
jgi:CO/xanthine dehydrogenase FAD-binding subunit